MARVVRWVVLVLALSACGATTAPGGSSGSPTVSPSSAVSALASATPATSDGEHVGPSAMASPTPAAVDRDLPVPGFALVTAERLLMRRDPGLGGEVITTADACIDNPDPNCEQPLLLGTERGYRWLYLFDGPVELDGYAWYLAATEMNTETHASSHPEGVGWVASGDESDAWLVPDPERSCPEPPIELADVTNLAMTRLERLECIGNQQLTLRGWYPVMPPDVIEDPAEAKACQSEQDWLACAWWGRMVAPVERTWAGDANYLEFVVDPGAGVSLPADGQWITVTGSFDHPAAAACGEPAAVLNCRFLFVVTAAEPGGE